MRTIDKYLHALGLQRCNPSLAFLSNITRRHVAEFAFSSIGPLLGDKLPLDIEALVQRIIVRRRGGYCFEQNGLMFEVLKELGFSVSLYLARVIYNQDIHPGLTHRISLVEIEGTRYVVDVGFGPLGPALPVNLSGELCQDTYRVFRIDEYAGGDLHMQTLKDGEFFSLYRFELTRYGQADCELGHFYSHRHPSATFVNHLVVSKIMDREVLSLRNHEFHIITESGQKSRRIEDPLQLEVILNTEFGISVTRAECRQLFSKVG